MTDWLADLLEAHILDKAGGRCRCNAEMSHTGHRTREHRAHLAAVIRDALTNAEAIERAARGLHARNAAQITCTTPYDELSLWSKGQWAADARAALTAAFDKEALT